MQRNQQAYDRGITIFSPDGRLYQVEYAREAVTQGAPCVAVRAADGVVLAAHAPRRSPLVEGGSVEKLHRIDDHVAVASAGHAADARRLVDLARRNAQIERMRYGEPTTVEVLSTAIADHVQEHTQTGGARPYGTALLVAGYDPDPHGEPRLFETDPSGATTEWRASAVGRNGREITSFFEDAYDPEFSLDGALELALEGLAHGIDADLGDEDSADPDEPAGGNGGDPREDLVAATVGPDGYSEVPDDQIGDVLESIAGE